MLEYTVRKPQVPTEKPPVLLALHGYGADDQDLLPIAEQLDPRFLIISLRAPIPLQGAGYAWYHLTQTESGLRPDDLSRHESEDEVAVSIAPIIEKEAGDIERVILMGFSQGAAIGYSLLTAYNLLNYGVRVLGSIHMSGYLPRDVLDPLSQKQFGGLPIFISHGEFDDLIPPMALTEAEELLSKQGANVTAKMYECGHGVLPETVLDIQAWVATFESQF
jgi:phospholipase/carboxylesterase